MNVKPTKENTFQIPKYDSGEVQKLVWFSIDPYLKAVIEINTVVAPADMLVKKLQYCTTVNEKIQAILALGLPPSSDENTKSAVINALKQTVLDDKIFWGYRR